MRIAHVIPALVTGGAQMMLAKLLEGDAGGHHQIVVALSPGGGLWPRVAASAAEVSTLGLRPGWAHPAALLRLVRLLRDRRADLVHGWMYHGNLAAALAGGLAGRLSGRPTPVLWNVRHSLYDLAREKPTTRAVIRAGAALSRTAAAIVYNSEVGARQHEARGYAAARSTVIPNGFDTALFRPDAGAGTRLRAELGVADSALLVGIVARYHPMKDHATLIRAGGRLAGRGREIFLVMAGQGVEPTNAGLVAALAAAGLERRAALLGERHDVPRIVAGLDAAVLCSAWGEGFPNALGEAMACGVPCVATDVGGCRWLLGPTGTIVPPGDDAALAAALEALAAAPAERRRAVGAAAQARIAERFALPAVVRQYDTLYERLLARRDAAGGA